jgi:hypothetical protein
MYIYSEADLLNDGKQIFSIDDEIADVTIYKINRVYHTSTIEKLSGKSLDEIPSPSVMYYKPNETPVVKEVLKRKLSDQIKYMIQDYVRPTEDISFYKFGENDGTPYETQATQNADTNTTKPVTKRTGIGLAVATGDVEKVKKIVSEHPEALKEVDHHGKSVMHEATVCNDDLEMMKTLIDLGGDIHATCMFNYRPLDNAAHYGAPKIVKLLIDHGAPKEGYPDNVSPIMSAAMEGYTAVVKTLIEAGVDPNTVDRDGYTALQHAISRNRKHTVKYLVENGSDLSVYKDAATGKVITIEKDKVDAIIGATQDTPSMPQYKKHDMICIH